MYVHIYMYVCTWVEHTIKTNMVNIHAHAICDRCVPTLSPCIMHTYTSVYISVYIKNIYEEKHIYSIYISIHLCMHITYTPTSLSLYICSPYIYICCIDSIHVHTDIQHALYMWGGCYAQSRTLLVQYEIVWRLSGPSPGWGLQWIPSANRLSCSCSNDWHILCCNVRHRTYNHNNAQQ